MSPLDSALLTAVGPDESLPPSRKDDSGAPDGDFGSTLSTVAAQNPGAGGAAPHRRGATSATDPSSAAPPGAATMATPQPASPQAASPQAATAPPPAPASSAPPTVRSTDPPGPPLPGGGSVPGPQGAAGAGSGSSAGSGPVPDPLPGPGPQTALLAATDGASEPPVDALAVSHPPLSTANTVAAWARSTLSATDPAPLVDGRADPPSGSAPGEVTSTTDSGPSAPADAAGPLPASGGLPQPGTVGDRSTDPSATLGPSSPAPAPAPATGTHSAGPPGATATTTAGATGSPPSPGPGGAGIPSPAAATIDPSAPPPATATLASGAGAAASSSASPQPTPAQQVVTVLAPLRSSLDGTHEVTIGLEPEGLGSVKATITVNAGQVVVQLGADNDQARDALRQALPLLRHELGDGSSASVLLSGDGGDGRRAQAGDRSASNDGSDNEIDLDDPVAAVPLPGSLRGHIDLHL